MRIFILNGPNLNLLGKREPEIYGSESFEEYYQGLQKKYSEVRLDYYQSNHEGHLVDKLHEVGFSVNGIILNAGAFTHTSIALKDAIASISSPVIEVHISNVYSREAYRHQSEIASKCVGVISGFKLFSYDMALAYFVHHHVG